MCVIKCHTDCPRCKTQNLWHSIDTHFQNKAGSVSLPPLPINAANTFIMHNHYKLLLDYLTSKSSNRWWSVEARFWDTVVMSSLLFLHIKEVNTIIMFWSDQVCYQLRDLQVQNHWHSVDIHCATGVSAIYTHLIWHRISLTLFW